MDTLASTIFSHGSYPVSAASRTVPAQAAGASDYAQGMLPPARESRQAEGLAQAALQLAPQVAVQRAEEDPASPEKLRQAIEAANRSLQSRLADRVRFEIDTESGEPVVRVVDAESGETLRQIPSEEMLRISKSLEKLQGLLLHQQA